MARLPGRIGQLVLRQVLAVDDTGIPTLCGTNAKVLSAGRLAPEDVGSLAACQDTEDETGPVTFVLGMVGEPSAKTKPLVISAGGASITLNPDGHIRLQGEEVSVDSAGRLRLLAGRIDLN